MGGVGKNPNACNITATTGQDVNASICPAGWRLPTAGANGTVAQNNNTNEFWNLNQRVNSGSASSPAGLLSNWLGVYAGFLWTDGVFAFVNNDGYYWSSSINSAGSSWGLRFNSTLVNPGINNNSKSGAFSVRCVADELPLTMQEVTIETCPTGRTKAVDARDNRTYWIRKIPNTAAGGAGDLCWMETNLAYAGGGDDPYGDVLATSTQGTAGTADGLTLHTAGATMENTNARYIVPDPLPTGTPAFTTSPTPPTTGNGNQTGANGAQYGFFYNWCAAMGEPTKNPNACNMTSTTGQDVNASICPAGWRLPTSGADGTTLQIITPMSIGI
jgi:uncharacterized protein (TIGR02145 family)